jgi:initiation factor 1A
MLGDGRAALSCYDSVARTGLIRGTMRRRVWINTVIIQILSKLVKLMVL